MGKQNPFAAVISMADRPVTRRETPIFNQVMDDIGLPGKTPLTLFQKNNKGQLQVPPEWQKAATDEVQADLDECRRRYE